MVVAQAAPSSDSDEEVLILPEDLDVFTPGEPANSSNPEVDGMELRGGKRLPDSPAPKDKGKQSQVALEPPPRRIPSPQGQKSTVDYNVIAHLKSSNEPPL